MVLGVKGKTYTNVVTHHSPLIKYCIFLVADICLFLY